MIRAVVDPSVLVSAFIGRQGSIPDQVVREWRSGRYELIVSPALLAELAAVLARPKFAHAGRDRRAEDFVDALRAGGTLAADVSGDEPITRDPDDDYLITLARATTWRISPRVGTSFT